ncbi:class I SAM-dependent methyltransferase [Mucilaginibacter sp. BJC16-A38]|uniref:class I SAM-dependent methyltransferase n=1 Tax=Mucilaginibacter phenanthrenivorans TaxID=1234842 RepID=UPI002157DF0C|nr:class I SAM-dependent methyltransferase [Mucilaginibacter phenanthrenivorans]MCR8557418.1 class I SAM-dependent methyltransferase [Mucilaginibacter phenanthrenivorans]
MGSAAIQGPLWGKQSENWATIQEQTGNAGYVYALNFLNLNPATQLLDVGCGSGVFSSLASATGAYVTGIDASEALIEKAQQRGTTAKFTTGEMEELPFAGNTFDAVCGFNSFQYAANINNAFTEVRRVLKPGGKLVVMIWGNKEDCEAVSNLAAIGSLLPPPPPGAPGPFALSENQLLEKTLEAIGFKILSNEDISTVWDYPDTSIALKGLLSSGPAARAIANSGLEKVQETVTKSFEPYIRDNGHVVYHNKFRIVISER